MKSKFLAPALFLLLCMALLPACSKQEPPKNKSPIPKVTVAQPQTEKMERIITAVGTLDSGDEVQVATEVAGIIQEIKFEEGQEVKQGATLVILDPTNFKLNIENAMALLERAKAGLNLAESTYERKKSLYEKKFITDQELQEFATALDRAKTDLTSATATYKIAEKALGDSVIKAPVDKDNENYVWEVQNKLVSIGEYVNIGKPVTELVNRIILKLRFTVPEQNAGYLSLNKEINFTVPASPNKEFTAKIFYLGPKAVEGTRAVIVKAHFNNTERILRSGYSANVRFIAETKNNALTIPRRALRFDVDKTYVWSVNDGVLHRKDVNIGIEKEDKVEIISGISQTDTIVMRSGSFLEDGTRIEIIEGK